MNKLLGYYTCDGEEFESKIVACIYATNKSRIDPTATGTRKVEWHFNDDAFSYYDWTLEPYKTLDELYNQRCRELREKYDYIMISYSGGADSHNIVMSFLRQNLHIDEIIINTTEKGFNAFGDNGPTASAKMASMSEYEIQAIPRFKELRNLLPKTKFTIFDATDYTLTKAFSNDESWVLNRKETLHPLNITRFNYIYMSDIAKTFDKNKKIGIILGVDKPRIRIDNNMNVYSSFSDRTANVVSMDEMLNTYTNITVELFYWSRECCELLCKQAHVIKRLIEDNPELIRLFLDRPGHSINHSIYVERLLRPALYSTWKKDWFQADKALMDWHSEFDSWFIDGMTHTHEYEIWKRGIDFVAAAARPFTYTKNNMIDGLITFTKSYRIGRLNINRINTIGNS